MNRQCPPKFTRSALPMVVAGMLVAGCGGDGNGGGATGVTINDLAGTWNATRAEVSPTGGGVRIDLLLNGGAVTLVIRPDETFTLTTTSLQLVPDTALNGTFKITGNNAATVTVGGGDPLQTTFQLSGNTLSVIIRGLEVIDFLPPAGIGPEDAVDLDATLTRTGG